MIRNSATLRSPGILKPCRYAACFFGSKPGKDAVGSYSATVLLPKSSFKRRIPRKARAEDDVARAEKYGFEELYAWQREQNRPEFVLHDGPPYANGDLHMGHVVNKVLKDVACRSQLVRGRKFRFIPGWDCHGLPIELKALGTRGTKDLSPPEIRRIARKFAQETVEKQKAGFKSWGVLGDWNNAYTSYSFPYVKRELELFTTLYEKGFIYRDLKPVHWSPVTRTALAEAELEYNAEHVSTSLFFLVEIVRDSLSLPGCKGPLRALIWTTTPWTLPGNEAVAFRSDAEYVVVKSPRGDDVLMSAATLENVERETGQKFGEPLARFPGTRLEGVQYISPLRPDCVRKFLPGVHVTTDKGTGLVHTAPAHGHDDFLLGLEYDLPLACHVSEDGTFLASSPVPAVVGRSVLGGDADAQVISTLGDAVFHAAPFTHSYPYDWRSKTPTIVRASSQWFFDTGRVKERALELLERVEVRPKNQESGMKVQLQTRPYWCISRQRCWGVPIPAFISKETGEAFVSREITDHLISVMQANGLDVWWELPTERLAPENLLARFGPGGVLPGRDVLDIWFDSGVSWACHDPEADPNDEANLSDAYLEGVDQFGGWFQSSLLTSTALRDTAPYRRLLVHGFVVDEQGKKMSKSLGNVVDPRDILRGKKGEQPYGVDVLRWWAVGYGCNESRIRVGPGILADVDKELDKSRNVIRFLLGTVSDLNPEVDLVRSVEALSPIDRYLLHLIADLERRCWSLYDSWDVDRVLILSDQFLNSGVSSSVQWLKDRLYCEARDSPIRRGSQTALYEVTRRFLRVIGPIVPHLAEEAWQCLPADGEGDVDHSLFKSSIHPAPSEWNNPVLAESVRFAEDVRRAVFASEVAGSVSPRELEVVVRCSEDAFEKLKVLQPSKTSYHSNLCEILQISKATLTAASDSSREVVNAVEGFEVDVLKTTAHRCPRCRKYCAAQPSALCSRCFSVLAEGSSHSKLALSDAA